VPIWLPPVVDHERLASHANQSSLYSNTNRTTKYLMRFSDRESETHMKLESGVALYSIVVNGQKQQQQQSTCHIATYLYVLALRSSCALNLGVIIGFLIFCIIVSLLQLQPQFYSNYLLRLQHQIWMNEYQHDDEIIRR
jgi:hypothetical protein